MKTFIKNKTKTQYKLTFPKPAKNTHDLSNYSCELYIAGTQY